MKESKHIVPPKEHVYLDGPKSRGYDLKLAFRVFKELLKAFRTLNRVGPCVTVFGSARFKEDHPYYKAAYEFGKRIADLGLTTMTGGGPGIMEAANKGAFQNGGSSVGCNIRLPFEQMPNPWVHKSIDFEYFFTRKTILIRYSYAFIIMPGGFGTMDEFYETLTLVQTKTITQFPIVVFGKEYYQPLIDHLHYMAEQGTINPDDLKLVLVTDDFDEAINHIKDYLLQNYTVRKKLPLWWLVNKS